MKLSYRKLENILRTEIDPKFEFEEPGYIGENYDLRKIYKAYGALGGGGGAVSQYEFMAMVRDCNMMTQKFEPTTWSSSS